MTDYFIYAIGILVNLIPFIILALAPFHDTFRVSLRKLAIIMLAISVCQVSTTLFIMLNFSDWKNYRLLYSLTFLVIYLVCYLTAVRANISKLLFVLIIIKNYADFVSPVAKYLELTFFPQDVATSYMPFFTVFQIAVLLITFPIIWYLMTRQLNPVLHLPLKNEWRTLWLIPAMFTIFNYLFTNGLSLDIISQFNYVIMLCVMMVGSLVVYFVVLKMLSETAENVRLTENARTTEQQLALEREHYHLINEHIEEAKRARHDLRHHLALLQSYLEEDDSEHRKLKEYISQYSNSLPSDTSFSLCKNYAVDAIVCFYIDQAQHIGIQTDIKLDLPEKIGVADSDLCIIFGNLLENAIEACNRQELSENRFLTVSAAIAGENVVITVDNSFDGEIEHKSGNFLSSKRTGNGIGTSSVKAVAERYNGITDFTYSEHTFHAAVMLKQNN